ncbi:hypothetical protein QI633_15065 [Nocardioides sp. QY071]|uniref:hypothetical protein n=1 Tax=Nocardioides sp. QY071 TaxID=3044187 RepID=UPI00249C3A87|nr:hypothetical protein [Nocardioides sp. QY071]WGX99858.1 hypothetical protein QI633_15065 [Nocardioides sp. QY071]
MSSTVAASTYSRGTGPAIMPGSLRAGRAAVCDAMAAGFAGPLRGSTAVDTRVSLRFLGADAVIARSEAGILLAGETGRPLPSGLVPETDPRSPFEMGEVPWLQPLPDARVRTAPGSRTRPT